MEGVTQGTKIALKVQSKIGKVRVTLWFSEKEKATRNKVEWFVDVLSSNPEFVFS